MFGLFFNISIKISYPLFISISFKLNKTYEKSPYKNTWVYVIICAVVGGGLGSVSAVLKNKKKKMGV